MSYFDHIEQQQFLLKLIKQEKTGTSTDLAKKLGIARRTFFRHLEELRMIGADICYCKIRKTYFLKNNFEFRNFF
ncbi:MAG: helix-turn-helix domain-containing protein [Mariniphaga sp.]|jgi:predicted ArsR family transcriptional regulator|nr:helix-turn-helix domain-containing protein [Mariniphaga sp.]MDD4227526.1 helix-turn-helix domain-containing protein [Mariniphaga sp.]